MNKFSISITKPHFRTLRMIYKDEFGEYEIFLDESTLKEYDWIGSEPSFRLDPDRLKTVLNNIYNWSKENCLRIKFWKKEELGI